VAAYPSPRPSRSCQNEERGKTRAGALTQGSSFLATAGLICETRFGVFKMAGDKNPGGGAEKVEGAVMKPTNRSGGMYSAAFRALGEWISWVVVEECVFVLEPRLIAAQQNSAESKDYSLRRQNDPVAPVVNESFQRRNTHESFVGGGSEQTSIGPRHVCVVPVEPTLKATAIKHLYVADGNHCQAQDGEEMEEVESAGEMVDAEGSHVKHKHGQNVSRADDAMESRAFEVEQNEGAEHETAYSGNDVED
jgi:hypothetical protein